ncbi:MAG: excinuclease ABC subunit UvrA, partial [Phycisphaerae bacterium]
MASAATPSPKGNVAPQEPGPNGDEFILVQGARQHNLKNLTVRIPRDKLVVVTGLSGSGKSSLAFDTIYAEGQRRYVESLSAYARQFLQQMEKPDVDAIEGLPPTIAIQQRRAGFSPRSTVATVTEIHDYLRLLFARVGEPHCPKCGRPIRRQRPEAIVRSVLGLAEGTRLMVLAPLVRGQRGEHKEVLRGVAADGFVRARVDGQMVELRNVPRLAKGRRHTIEAVVDRLVAKEAARSRLADSVETALRMSDGLVVISHEIPARRDWKNTLYSERYACVRCNLSFEELSPRLFSFNSPYGACPTCHGLGAVQQFDENLIVPDVDLSLAAGALAPWKAGPHRYRSFYEEALARFIHDFKVDPETPFRKLPKGARDALLHGGTPNAGRKREPAGRSAEPWEGIIPSLQRLDEKNRKASVRRWLEQFMSEQPCPACRGARLRPEARAVTVGGKA